MQHQAQTSLAVKGTTSPSPPPQRTVRASFPAYGSRMAKAPLPGAGLAIQYKTSTYVISLAHLIAETGALNCRKTTTVSSKLPHVGPQILARDSHTSRKSAPFQVRAKFELLSGQLQSGIRFLRVLLPASPTASLTGRLPTIRCSECWQGIGLTTFPFWPTSAIPPARGLSV